MASVSSLDQDMRRLRMDRYTPQAAGEARSWIESTLGEKLQDGDLLDALKDGVALCKLANLVLPPPGIKYKASSMPFTQRENISQFLTACERQPLVLPAHDRFLTVDLYDNKDPAQVLQCIGAFSRAANAVNPSKIRTAIGPKRNTSPTRRNQPNGSGSFSHERNSSVTSPTRERALSPTLTGGSNTSNSTATSNAHVSSWSKKSDEFTSAPAWNIHQYGYMGGASQGNQGVSFGARRQITSMQPNVPSLADKERKRREQEAEGEKQRKVQESAERQRRQQRDDDERQTQMEEQRRWEEEEGKAREQERQQLELDRKKWEEEERQWQEEDAKRKKEMEQTESLLKGQALSQNQIDQNAKDATKAQAENERIRELERQLEEAKERERQYQLEREQRDRTHSTRPRTPETPDVVDAYRRPDTISMPKKDSTPSKTTTMSDSWVPDERQRLRQVSRTQNQAAPGSPATSQTPGSSRPLPDPTIASSEALQATPQSMRPGIATPAPAPAPAEPPSSTSASSETSTRPLPLPNQPLNFNPKPATPDSPSTNQAARTTFSRPLPSSTSTTRTDTFLAHTPAPAPPTTRTTHPTEMSLTSSSEREAEDTRRKQSQQQTTAGGWASKSLLEREMDRERERQKEWEEAQLTKRPGSGLVGPRGMGSKR